MTMQNICQFIYLMGFLMLAATNCMAGTIVNQAEVDDSPHQLIKRSESDRCLSTTATIRATVTATVCGLGAGYVGGTCTLTAYRASYLGLGFMLTTGSSLIGVTGLTGLTGLTSAATITFNVTTVPTGANSNLLLPMASINGITGGNFYRTTTIPSNTTGITGVITAATTFTFTVSGGANPTIGVGPTNYTGSGISNIITTFNTSPTGITLNICLPVVSGK